MSINYFEDFSKEILLSSCKEIWLEVLRCWPFNTDKYKLYPEDKVLIGSQTKINNLTQTMFMINHLILHQNKTLGKIAAIVEKWDHNGADNFSIDDHNQLTRLVAEQIINSFRLGDALGINGLEIGNALVDWTEESHKYSRVITNKDNKEE